jgi:hypothetical protein
MVAWVMKNVCRKFNWVMLIEQEEENKIFFTHVMTGVDISDALEWQCSSYKHFTFFSSILS